jgi:hypothetical protein
MTVFMRVVSLVLIVIALMLLGADLITSLEMRGTIVVRSVATVWNLLDAGGPDAVRQWCAGTLPSFLCAAVDWLLGVYCWAIPGLLGVALAFAFGRKETQD